MNKRHRFRPWLRAGLFLGVGLVVLVAAGGWLMYARLAQEIAPTLPAFEPLRTSTRGSETLLLSREGEVLQRLRSNPQVRQGEWVALDAVSPAVQTALRVSEDKRFYRHGGVDWLAVMAAAWHNVFNRQARARVRGASTLTMQLTGLIAEQEGKYGGKYKGKSAGRRNLTQKLRQAVAARELEKRWSKTQILEAYLNLVPFRGELVGVAALAQTLFGKAAHSLDAREAAIAAALIRAPNAAPSQVAQRACGVWQAVAVENNTAPNAPDTPNCASLTATTRSVLNRRNWPASAGLAPHLARRLLHATGKETSENTERSENPQQHPPTLPSTLSAPLQRFAVASLQQHLRELRGRNVADGAVLVLDNATGEVLAWVGSSGDLSEAAEVDAVTALRQPGSTLKPFLYAQALAERRLTAASLVEDSSAHLLTPNGLYIPQNYDRHFKGWVSVRTALAASLNVPAVRTLVMVTPDAFFRQLQALGLNLAQTGGWYGYSLALGSAEVSLLNLTNAYRALANGGRYTPVRWQPMHEVSPEPVPVLDPRAAFIVADILADNLARAPTFGLDSVLATRFWSAVKTGTSKDMRDNWAIGWSRQYTVGVWVGNADGAPMHAVSGTDGAAPIWADIMRWLHENQQENTPAGATGLAFLPPVGVLRQAVQFDAALQTESARNEWFIAGTEQARFARPATLRGADGTVQHAGVRIVRPASGTIFALDPDIPPDHQRVRLQARALENGASDHAANTAADTANTLRWQLAAVPTSHAAHAAHAASSSPSPQTIATGMQADWLPLPGQHRIELVNAQGQVLDSVRVEVRGASLATQTPNRHTPNTNPPR